MKRARRLSQRLVRWTSLCVCFALVLSCLAIVPFASVTGKSRVRATRYGTARGSERVDSAPGLDNGNGQGRRVAAPQPQPGPPRAGLPNLDDVRRATPRVPRAPLPIPSRQRRWRHVMPVIRAAADSKSSAVKANHVRGTSPTVREGFEVRRFAPAALNADRMSALPAALPAALPTARHIGQGHGPHRSAQPHGHWRR